MGTAAILTGTDPVKIQQLPHLAGTGMKDRVIAQRFPRQTAPDGREYIHYGYAHALKTTGVQFDEVGNGGPGRTERVGGRLRGRRRRSCIGAPGSYRGS